MARRYRVIWTPVAQKDLEAVVTFISRESPQSAAKVLRTIRLKAALLYRFPQRGRYIPELSHIPGLPFRELILASSASVSESCAAGSGLTPWRLLYRMKEDRVEILALFDGRRDLSEVLFERLSRVG